MCVCINFAINVVWVFSELFSHITVETSEVHFYSSFQPFPTSWNMQAGIHKTIPFFNQAFVLCSSLFVKIYGTGMILGENSKNIFSQLFCNFAVIIGVCISSICKMSNL